MSAFVAFNKPVFLWFHHFAGRWPVLDGFAVFCALWLPYLVMAIFLALVFYQPGLRRKFYLFAESALAIIFARGIITTTIHFFYFHPRPFLTYSFTPLIAESGSSFPSGHAAWFFALATIVWLAPTNGNTNRKWGWWFFGFAALISIGRIYTGVHWPLDIIGGAVIGIAIGWLVHWLLKEYHHGIVLAERRY